MVKARVFRNKRNGQLTIFLPKLKMDFIKHSNPKFIELKNIREEDFEF